MVKNPPQGATTFGRFHLAEGDSVRNKNWCIHYNKTSKRCCKRYMKCPGSSYCDYYTPDEKHEVVPIIKSKTKIKGLPVVKFDGVKMVDISLISVSDKALASPNHKHIEYFENIFKKTGKVEPPLTVSCNGSYYLIEDGNSRFFAALNLGFTKVPIEIGTRENNDIKKRLKVGTKIRYGSYGEGVIIEIKDKFMKIKFSNYETSLDMDLAIKSNMLKIL